MRVITKKMINAIVEGRNFKGSNTEVVKYRDGLIEVYLFDNLIAQLGGGTLFITNAGYKTVTTKERLNGILGHYNLGYLQQSRGVWYLIKGEYSLVFECNKTFKV